MKQYRVLKEFGGYAIGAVIDLADDVAKGLLAGGCIEEVKMDASLVDFKRTVAQKIAEAVKAATAEGARQAMASMNHVIKGADVQIEMGKSEEEKLISTGGFKSFGHFAYNVFKVGKDGRGVSPELARYCEAVHKAPSGMGEAVDADGGYLTPTEHAALMLEKSMEASIVRPRATVVPMASSSVDFPAVKDDDRSSSIFGGITIYRKAEGAQLTGVKPALRKIGLKLTKLTGLCYVTEELMADSPQSIDPLLNRLFPAAMAFWEDNDFLNGSGAGEPMGALSAGNPCIISITKEALQAADTIVAENIIKMYARCYGKNNAIWVANHDTFPQLATLVLKVGTAGVPLWLPGNNQGIAGAPNGTLMGRPLILTEMVPTLGDAGDIALCDFSQYLVGERAGEGIKAATSIHLRFDYDEVAFRFTLRDDGQPWWKSTFTPKNGTTMSPFVRIEARA